MIGVYKCPEPEPICEVPPLDMGAVMEVVLERGVTTSPDSFSVCGEGAELLGALIFRGTEAGIALPDQYVIEGPGANSASTVNYWHADLDIDDTDELMPISIDVFPYPYTTWWLSGEIPGIEERDLCYWYDDVATEFVRKKINTAISEGSAVVKELSKGTYSHFPKGLVHTRPPIEVFDRYRLFGKRFVE